MTKLIYLVNPKDEFLEHAGDRIPIGLLMLSAYLKQHNHQTKIIDLNHDELLTTYLDETPDFICFTVPTPNYKQVIDYVKRLKPFFKST